MDSTIPTAELAALLGRGTHFEGKLHFEGRVRIDGRFRGEILSSEAVLVVGDGAGSSGGALLVNIKVHFDVAGGFSAPRGPDP